MIKVLIAEDSSVVQAWLVHILEQDPTIHVIGRVSNGEEAVAFVARLRPDVITMDINMPKLDGIEATRRIMETNPVPIVVVSSSWNPAHVTTTIRAMDAGALAVVETPRGGGNENAAIQARNLIQTVKSMAEVRVVRRWPRVNAVVQSAHSAAPHEIIRSKRIQVVAVGVSTGGPPVLRTLLGELPKDFAAPILIVQHIASGFLPGLVAWLREGGSAAHIAEHRQVLQPGSVYLAPDDFQMGLDSSGAIVLADAPAENGLRPSVSYLFRSVSEVCGARAIGVLLTGMGRDGAAELKSMRDRGAITFAQDRESSVVHGMPGEAIRLGGAVHVLAPEKIASTMVGIVQARSV